MSNRVCVRVTPIKTIPTLTRTSIHNERREGDRTGSHINKSYSGQNELLFGSDTCNVWKSVVEEVTGRTYTDSEWDANIPQKEDLFYQDGRKVRKDAALAAEIEIHYPGRMVDDPADAQSEYPHQIPADMKEFNRWKELTTQFILERFGSDNVKQVVLHMDELTPHVHAIFIPKYQDKDNVTKLSYHRYVDGKKACAMLQTQYADKVKELGYKRGIGYSGSEHTAVRRMRKIMTKDMNAQLPSIKEGQTMEEYKDELDEIYQDALTKANYLTESNRQLKNVQKSLERRNQKIEELEQLVSTLQTNEQELKTENRKLKKKIEKSEYERVGCMIHPDQEMIRNIYLPLKGSLTESGKEYMKEHFDIADSAQRDDIENIQEQK